MHWPCCCTIHFCVVFHFCGSMWSFWVVTNLCIVFITCLYMYLTCRSSYQEGWVEIRLTGISPPHLCVCPNPGHGFPRHMSWAFCVHGVRLRSACSSCWCWRNNWPSLFINIFHAGVMIFYKEYKECWTQKSTLFLIIYPFEISK